MFRKNSVLQSKTLIFGVFLFILLLFSSCKNYTNSSSAAEDLKKAIDYVNADYVQVTMDVLYSYTESITPTPGIYNSTYKQGDVINITFKPDSGYQFIEWTAEPKESVLFDNPLEPNTKAAIVKSDSPIVIKPICEARPYVTSMLPTVNENGVPKTSVVQINFSQKIPESAIKFTTKELAEIGITNDSDYEFFKRGTDKDGNSLYYAYTKDGEKYYKNIQIKRRGTQISLAKYFGEAYVDDSEKTSLFIMPDPTFIPEYTEIEIIINQELFNTDNISMKEPYSNYYITNDQTTLTDNVAPSIIEIQNIWVEGAKTRTDTSGSIPLHYIKVTKETDEIVVHFSGTVLDFGYTGTSTVRDIYLGLDIQKNYDKVLGGEYPEINSSTIDVPQPPYTKTYVFENARFMLLKEVEENTNYTIFMWAKDVFNVGKPIDTRYILIYDPE